MKRKYKGISPYEFFPRTIRWLSNHLTKSNNKELSYALWVADKILTVLRTRGKTQAIKYCKDLRSNFLRLILSMNPEFEFGDQSRFPKILKPIIRHIKESKSYPFIRLIFSALYITRFIKVEPNPSFRTIEEGPFYRGNPQDLREDMIKFLKDLGINTKHGLGKVPKKLRFGSFHMTSKAGPNGHALWTSYLDFIAIPQHLLSAIRIVGGEKLVDLACRFHTLYQRIPSFFAQFRTRKGTRICRRLIALSDKEGKTREVACLDYYSQAALLPLHNYLFKVLRRIDQDCTHAQSKTSPWFRAPIGQSFHSVDLTAATDRFPIEIQRTMLEVWFGKDYADAWKDLMVKEPFSYGNIRKVQYNTGNPMGAYSSWAIFALCHHFFVWLACKRTNRSWKHCRYMLLGDDIVIANDAVAEAYKGILGEWCIEYSREKTHVSPYGFEFAKQIYVNKVNVSPFPLSALYDRRSETITSLGIIWHEVTFKAWKTPVESAVKSYFLDVLRISRPLVRSMSPKISLVVSLMGFYHGSSDLGKSLLTYVAEWTGREFKFDSFSMDLYGQYLSLKILERHFLDSQKRLVTGNTPLGQLATDMVCHITSLRDGGADCFDLIEAVPFLQVYGRAEETYIDLISRKEWLSPFMMGESRSLLKKHLFRPIDIPTSDAAFYERHRDVLVHQTWKTALVLIDLLQSTPSLSIPVVDINLNFPWARFCRTKKRVVWESNA